MELKSLLAQQLLSAESWTDQRKRDLVASVLLICPPDPDSHATAINGIEAGRYRIDEKLLSDLYRAASNDIKIALVGTTAFTRLSPAVFERLFMQTWRIESMSLEQRETLVNSLSAFLLARHPERAERFRDILLEMLWSRNRYISLRGLGDVGFLSDLAPRDLDRLKRKATAAFFGFRMNAFNALCHLVKRHREVSPEVLAFCTSKEIRAIARRLNRTDPDKRVRTCAYYLLKALREYDRSR